MEAHLEKINTTHDAFSAKLEITLRSIELVEFELDYNMRPIEEYSLTAFSKRCQI